MTRFLFGRFLLAEKRRLRRRKQFLRVASFLNSRGLYRAAGQIIAYAVGDYKQFRTMYEKSVIEMPMDW